MEVWTFIDFGASTCFMDKELVRQYNLVLVKKNIPMSIEVINGQSFSSGLVTHETKPLDVTIDSHTSKVIFNVISSPINLVIIGLSWLVLHNLRMDWHTWSLHFETPQHEALECETFVKSMQILKQKECLGGTRRPSCPKPLFVTTKAFMKATTRGDAFLIYVFPLPDVEPRHMKFIFSTKNSKICLRK
jgi:hypothetical protein